MKTVDKTVGKPQKKRPLLVVDLGELQKPWNAFLKRNGETPSNAIKQVIKRLIGVGGKVSPSYSQLEGLGEGRAEKKRMVIRWTVSESSAIQEQAGIEISSPQNWVINLVRSHLTRKPQFGMREIEALGESNSQLLRIGRNLNQIAKALNTNPEDTSVIKIERIEQLAEQIELHTNKVSALLEANVERWQIR